MLPAERRARIVAVLKDQRAVRVPALSEDLGVSEITIRRDLLLLEQAGVLERTYGGAVLKEQMTAEPRWERAVGGRAPEKDAIARVAAEMIESGDTVFLGSGTTVINILRHIAPGLEVRVVTHNLAAALEARGPSLEFVFLGGLYRPQLAAVEGTWPLDMISQFNADKAFLGVDCLDLRAGLTTPSIAVATIELAMIRRTRGEVVVLTDSTKIGLVGPLVICPLDQIDVVLVDDGIDPAVSRQIQRAGPRCEVVRGRGARGDDEEVDEVASVEQLTTGPALARIPDWNDLSVSVDTPGEGIATGSSPTSGRVSGR
jgi:DeoR/GlpR family transcriptional regulator of sugar metabolism